MDSYDLIVIGAGPGGYEAALEGASLGMKTALIEKNEVGGTCLNRGCIPTKSLLHASHLFQEMKNASRFGLSAEQSSFSLESIQRYKEENVIKLRQGIEQRLHRQKVTLYQGTAVIASPHQVIISGREEQLIEGRRILAAPGSVPSVPSVPGADCPHVMTSDGLLSYQGPIFSRLLIIGGGVIGMEFASVFQALGSQVIVLEAMDRILANFDKEISQSLKMLMKKRGAEIHTAAQVFSLQETPNNKVLCQYREKEQTFSLEADAVLLAAGRKPCISQLFSSGCQPAMERGYLLTDENFRTSIPSIYAAGDAIGKIQLAHAAAAQGISAVRHMAGKASGICLAVIPSCVYTDPEIASAGMTLEEATAAGIDAQSRKYPMSANGKSVLTLQERGFMKVVFGREDHRVLGAQLMCARASDLISEFTSAVVHGFTVEQVAEVIRPHPSFSEGISEAVKLCL